jgi:SAM-dependent methyltransferase
MNAAIQDRRQPLPSISTVYGPIEDYWESVRPAGGPGPEPSELLDPLDAFLVHRFLELVPGRPLLIDAAMAQTCGASSLIGLALPRVRAVWAVTQPGSLVSERAAAALRGHIRSRGPGPAPLELVPRTELAARLADQAGALILADARAGDVASLGEEIGHWLEERPDAIVLVLGLGRVGECPAIASLLSRCTPESGKRLRLLRELNEVLMASHLGLIARHDHPHVEDALLRLQQGYTGNYRYLDLLRAVNDAALREARIDADVMRNHPFCWALTEEMDELKQAAREAQEALQAAREEIPTFPQVVSSFRRMIRRMLSPTLVGRTYRFGKRVVGAGLNWVRPRTSGRGHAAARGGTAATPGHPAPESRFRRGKGEAPGEPRVPERPARQKPRPPGYPPPGTDSESGPRPVVRLPADREAGEQPRPAVPAIRPAAPGFGSSIAPSSGGREEISEAGALRLERLLPLLACPTCHAPVEPKGQALLCDGCQARFALHAGRPAFLPGGTAPRIMPVEHLSNQPPPKLLDWMTWFDGWILNIGAGGTHVKLENVVEMEYSLFRHTDVAADAHHLPFADASFDAVVSFNTFEHLAEPDRAAAEIFRVLKPGGRVVVHTAFLQPVHEPPHHYYNTTEYGLRRWFRAFEIDGVSVSENFHPGHVVAWLASDLLRAVEAARGAEARDQLAASSLDFWRATWEDPARREHPLWDLMRGLPQQAQMHYAAGFQLDARKSGEAKSTAA